MKLNLNSARKGNSSYTFRPISLVSIDYGRLQPTMSWHMTIGDKFPRVNANGLLRCTPQVFPPFGRMNLKSAAFFVPESQIFSWSSAFHSDNKLWRGQIADSAPWFTNTDFNFFFAYGSSYLVDIISNIVFANPSTVPARNTYDFSVPVQSGRVAGSTNLNYFRLTPFGWKIYAVFKALGYDFVIYPTDFTGALSYQQHRDNNKTRISAVKFLSYAKIWNDFFCNSYQSDKNVVSDCLQKIYLNKDVTVSGTQLYFSSNFEVYFPLLFYMLNVMSLPFETNMFTNAWNTVNDPTGVENSQINQIGSGSLISPYGGTNFGELGSISPGIYGNYHSTAVDSSNRTTFSALGHKTLDAFDKFVRRRNLVGSKAVQQLYALFGIEPDEWNKDYVVKLAESSREVRFSAITSQADTSSGGNGKPLGAFAGTGLGGYELDFGYESNTYGHIICVAWLNIDPILMHGIDADNLRTKPLDFYNPDFDGKAYRPIPYLEITGAKALDADNLNAVSVYGYTNMYNDLRMMRDVVAGAFTDDFTRNFAFMRDMSETRNNSISLNTDMYPQSKLVQYWDIDGNSDLTNPFITSASAGDRFWFCIDWNINCTRPILSSENSLDLDGEGSISIKKNGDGMA